MAASSCGPWASTSERAALNQPDQPRRVDADPARLRRWLDGFADRHGRTTWAVVDGALDGVAEDGSTARCAALLPFEPRAEGAEEPAVGLDAAFVAHVT